jgi:hypothetical protein
MEFYPIGSLVKKTDPSCIIKNLIIFVQTIETFNLSNALIL